jgi:hypothetical protein
VQPWLDFARLAGGKRDILYNQQIR